MFLTVPETLYGTIKILKDNLHEVNTESVEFKVSFKNICNHFEHICLYSGLQRNFSLYSMCYQKFSKHIHSLGCGIHLSPVTLRTDIKVRLLYVYVYG